VDLVHPVFHHLGAGVPGDLHEPRGLLSAVGTQSEILLAIQ
jgi:hypothetical protein